MASNSDSYALQKLVQQLKLKIETLVEIENILFVKSKKLQQALNQSKTVCL